MPLDSETDIYFSRGFAVDTTQNKTQLFASSYKERYGDYPTNFVNRVRCSLLCYA